MQPLALDPDQTQVRELALHDGEEARHQELVVDLHLIDVVTDALMETGNGLYKGRVHPPVVFLYGPYETIADVQQATAGWVDYYTTVDA